MSVYKHWDFANVDIINEALKATVASNPHLGLIESEKVIFNKNKLFAPEKKVIVLSGGGSGHEPLHGGLVGENFLDVAVAGAIYASPSTKQILSAIVTIGDLLKEKGLPQKSFLIIVKNYTGDVLHFGLALERAKSLGFDAEMIIVQDDVSVGKTNGGLVGKRGLAGTALVHKIAGGLAAKGESLTSIVKTIKLALDSIVTIGASLDHCSIPGRKISEEEAKEEADNSLPLDFCEIGMGIHNETGVKRIKIPPIEELIKELLQYLLKQDDPDRSYVKFEKSDEFVLLINNLGGTSNLELFSIAQVVLEQLSKFYQIKPVRIYIGNFVTSLNGNGFSITLLNLNLAGGVEKILGLLDLPTDCIGWNSTINWSPIKSSIPSILAKPTTDVSTNGALVTSSVKVDPKLVKSILESCIKRIAKIEPKVTEYDTIAGDGDCGETLLAGSNAIDKELKDVNSIISKHLDDPVTVIFEIANVLEDSMGGTSGGLYSIYMSSFASSLKSITEKEKLSIKTFSQAAKSALESLFKYTKARTGDKTLIDTLEPFITALLETNDLQTARNVAIKSAKNTKKLDAKFGRASYVSKEEIAKFHTKSSEKSSNDDEEEDLDVDDDSTEGVPDPGAIGLAAIIDGCVKGFHA